jgi:hypothetical protein
MAGDEPVTAAEQGAAECSHSRDYSHDHWTGDRWVICDGPPREQGAAVDGPSVAEVLAEALCQSPANRAGGGPCDEHRELAVEAAPALIDHIAAEVSRQVAAREAEAVDAALREVERRVGGAAMVAHLSWRDVLYLFDNYRIVREARRPARATTTPEQSTAAATSAAPETRATTAEEER